MKVGLDISLNSTAVCVEKNESYSWINFSPNITERTRKFLDFQSNENCLIYSFDKDTRKFKDLDISESIIVKYKNFNNLYNRIKESIFLDNKVEYLSVEGPSYNSRGRAQIDLVVCSHYIIFKIISELKLIPKIIPPSKVKLLAGKGNYNKHQMLEAFKKNILQDEKLDNDPFYKWVCGKEITTKSIPKPIDDLIDSYFVLKNYPS